MRRRAFLTGISGLLLASRALAEDSLVIVPNTPSSGQDSLYARLANVGPYGYPRQAVQITPRPDLRLDIYLPPGQAQGRVVVFSHGELGDPTIYAPLLTHWASHGFIVIAPIHDDSLLRSGLRIYKGGKEPAWDLNSVVNDPATWDAREQACRAVLNVLPELEASSAVKFVDDRPVIAGHSLGAYTAETLVGARSFGHDGAPIDHFDRRFYAGLLLSPPGDGVLGLRQDSWGSVQRPTMTITGDGDTGTTGQKPEERLDSFTLAPAGNRHLAWFSRINQLLYAGQQVFPGTPDELVFQDLLAVTTGFLKAYADYDASIFQALAGAYFDQATEHRVATRYR